MSTCTYHTQPSALSGPGVICGKPAWWYCWADWNPDGLGHIVMRCEEHSTWRDVSRMSPCRGREKP